MGTIERRRTRQGEAIWKVLGESEVPLSVPEIHSRAALLRPGLGLATVYRRLRRLAEDGSIRALRVAGESYFSLAEDGRQITLLFDEKRRAFAPLRNILPFSVVEALETKIASDFEIIVFGSLPEDGSRNSSCISKAIEDR
ncbi:MAG: transcriptional repressor [Opitutales bacterium]